VIPQENLSVFNTKVRNKDYIAPEQISLGQELDDLLGPKNGRLLDPLHHHLITAEVAEFAQANLSKINKTSDIYAIGAILYRLLLGVPPTPDISEFIAKKRLAEKSPS
jgi:serine/threonine protein kinase